METAAMEMNQPVISFEKNKLHINMGSDRKIVEFQYEIGKIEKFDNCIIVMIDIPMKIIFNENIYSVSYYGKILWQIEKINHMDKDSPFMGMGQDENGFSAYNWDSFNYKIDLKTGKIMSRQYVK